MDIKLSSYLSSLKNIDGSSNFSASSNSSFLPTSFGIMIDFLMDEKYLKNNKSISYLEQGISQNSTKIIEPTLKKKDLIQSDSIEYVENQISYFSVIALDVLGKKLPKLSIVDDVLESDENLIKWFESLNLAHFWYESNRIMFVFYFLFYIEKYAEENRKMKAAQRIQLLINLLNNSQDKKTGFWGTNLNGNNLYDGCYGAAHILLFYDYLNEEIPWKERIVDNTLKLHAKNGLMRTTHGSACEDYDAIDIYLRCLNQLDYRKDEIYEVLCRMKKTIISSQSNNGGYPYKVAGNFYKQVLYDHILKREYSYSGWAPMKTRSYSPDLWATWFRILSIKVIDFLLNGDEDFNSYWLPAWGYIK